MDGIVTGVSKYIYKMRARCIGHLEPASGFQPLSLGGIFEAHSLHRSIRTPGSWYGTADGMQGHPAARPRSGSLSPSSLA